jgi:hypothetical protein
MAHVGQFRLAPGGLAVKTAVGIARACVRVVPARLAVEVSGAIGIAGAILGAKALLTLIAERVQHVNRIKGLLFAQGISDYEPLSRKRRERLEGSDRT